MDLRGRKRYLDVALTGGDGTAGTYAAVWANLFEGEVGPTTTTEKGAAQVLRAPSL